MMGKDTSNPEMTLRKGSQPKGNDMSAPGNSQAATEATTSSNGSNLETLRLGSKPKPESVRQASMDPSCVTKARAAWQASNGDQKAPRAGNIRKEDEKD